MSDKQVQNEDGQLDELFQQYRWACPEVEPSAHFMPELWGKIDARRSLWFHFGKLGKGPFERALLVARSTESV